MSETTDREILNELLEEVAKKEGFLENCIEILDEILFTGGYLSIIVRANIFNKCEPKQILHVLAKLAPKNEILRSQITASDIFKREIFMYETIFPKFEQIERQNNLPPTIFTPKVFKVNKNEKSEILVMENLCTSGYILHDNRNALDEKHIKLVFSKYGRLHALSFALREKNPECFNTLVNSMEEIMIKFITNGNFFEVLRLNNDEILKLLKPTLSNEHYNSYKKFIESVPDTIQKLVSGVDEQYVIIHGDSRLSNMMFKCQEGTNIPIDMKFVDFQVSRLTSPVIDLSYFFYTSCSKEELENLENYLRVYYNNFSSHLRNLGCCPEKLFPYSALKDHWKKYAWYGLLMAPSILKIMLSSHFDDMVKSGQSIDNALIQKVSNTELYKQRIESVVLHFLNNEYI